MTYSAIETSEYNAQPVELYSFECASRAWRYTSADEDKFISPFNYTAIPLKRSAFEENQDVYRSLLTLTMSRDVPFLDLYRYSPPTDIVQLTINRYHEGDSEVTTPWMGRVTNVKFLESTAEVRCEPVFTSLRRPILRRRYQTTCPHVLYEQGDGKCNVLKDSFKVNSYITAIDGIHINGTLIAVYPDGHFSGGFAEWFYNGITERRSIVDHIGAQITLAIPFNGLQVGETIAVFPGCDHSLTTCDGTYNNVINFGGQPFYPDKNPFTGTVIF